MFEKLIRFSLENKLLVLLAVLALVILGIFSASKIPLDAVPDITNNQVQIVSTSPTLAPQEVEQLITYPLEAAMTNIPDVIEVRSISRYGLSVITIVFEEHVSVMLARQFVQEQLNVAKANLPEGLTEPELMPITTGLGEIYQYVLTVDEDHAHLYDQTELRTLQDWIVKRQLNGTQGVIEVSSFGGFLKQYEVAIDPVQLRSHELSVSEVLSALRANNQNSGGSYIESGPYSYYIRTQGRIMAMEEIEDILVDNRNGIPIRVGDIAEVRIGSAKRYGAMTMDGQGEVVGGITLMLKGANSSEVLANVKKRIAGIEKTLPEGVGIYPYLDRSKLIGKTIQTVQTNLIEGGLIVIFILLLLLGNLRAGLIVASIIPLSMLFALTMMRYFGISANLMSLGAIDFGIVIDGAVIIVESLLHVLTLGYIGKKLTQSEMDGVVEESASKIYRAAAFGVLIILVVFIPILTLEGIEGKTFRPMAQTVGFAILGSMILSLTYVPVMASLFLNKNIKEKRTIADRIVDFLKRMYKPTLGVSLKAPYVLIILAMAALLFTGILFNRLGAEFVPTLEEGDLAMQQAIKPGSSLNESIRSSTMAEKILLDNFPEVIHVVSKIGTAEVPTDPMAIEDADIMIILKDKELWTSASNREDLIALMKEKLEPITWASYEFTQPIQLRFNELMTGSKSDISVKIFGEDVNLLKTKADEVEQLIQGIAGVGDVKVDQTDGLQQLSVKYDRQKLAQHGINVDEVNDVIRAAYAGEQVGDIYEEERRFDLVVRFAPQFRQTLDLDQLTIPSILDRQIPISEVATISNVEGPMLISREQARRFINIGVNVRNRDVSSLVFAIRNNLTSNLDLPPGYEIQYGGQFENLEHARDRLMIAVPIALALILLLLYMAFNSLIDTLIIFMAVPLSAVGGILALWVRSMPFSISSGIGFIALFGVSVLNGIVLLSAIKQLKEIDFTDLKEMISTACLSRLRPVLMTALVAAFGFLPMALSTGSGAEVQRPLATVVIGGLISSTLLTLVLLPTLYFLIYKRKWMKKSLSIIVLFFGLFTFLNGQSLNTFEDIYAEAVKNNIMLKNINLSKNIAQLEENKIGQWSPVSINYQGGQINISGYDHYLSVHQDISHLFRKNEKNVSRNLIQRNINVINDQGILFTHELKRRLHHFYNQANYWYSQTLVYDNIIEVYNELHDKIRLQYEVGEIDVVEWELFNNEKIRKEQKRNLNLSKVDESRLEVIRTALLSGDIELTLSGLKRLPQVVHESEIEKTIHSRLYQNKIESLEKENELQEISALAPNINVGYFTQSLEESFLFHGFNLGVTIPMDRRSVRTKTEQNEIVKMQIENQREEVIVGVNNKLRILQSNINQLKNNLNQFDSSVRQNHSVILDKIKLQYELGEIDFIRFNQIQEKILNDQINYLDWLKEYNDHIIEYNYWISE